MLAYIESMSQFPHNESASLGWLAPPTPVVRKLMWTCAILFVGQILDRRFWQSDFFLTYLALSGKGLKSFMIWQPATYAFLHAGLWHILFNLLALWMFGRYVEMEIGPRRFLTLYLYGAILGGLLWAAVNYNTQSLVVGASGAVLAVIIAFATLYPEQPITLLLFLVIPVTLKAKYLAILATIVVLYGALMGSTGVADLAHLGGIVFGYAYIKWLGYGRAPWWIRLLRGMFASDSQPRQEADEFHSSRPGIPYNHPYRTAVETERRPPRAWFGWGIKKEEKQKRVKRPLSKEEFIQREVDPILDKIAKHGIQSLTPEERSILEEAGRKLQERR